MIFASLAFFMSISTASAQDVPFANDDLSPTLMDPQSPSNVETNLPPPFIAPADNHSNLEDEVILQTPTRSIERYEEIRLKRLRSSEEPPHWSVNLNVAPVAFRHADFRTPATEGSGKMINPALFGVFLGIERLLLQSAGVLSVGLEGGVYETGPKDNFDNLAPLGFLSISPYAQYALAYLDKQWIVPVVKAQYESVRYNYSFQGMPNKGFKHFPRFDIGMLVFLNIFEPASSGQLMSDFGIKRTYLSAVYSVANDGSKTPFDMSDRAFRVGLRFEY